MIQNKLKVSKIMAIENLIPINHGNQVVIPCADENHKVDSKKGGELTKRE